MKLSAILLTTMLASTVSITAQSTENESEKDTTKIKKCTTKITDIEKSEATNNSIPEPPHIFTDDTCIACGMG